jgi:hypothetical protein
LFGECQVNRGEVAHPSEIDLSDRQSKCRFGEDDSLWGRVALVKCNVISIYPKSVYAFFGYFWLLCKWSGRLGGMCVEERLRVVLVEGR